MPVIVCNGKLYSLNEPIDKMSDVELAAYREALLPHTRNFPISASRKIRDIEFEIERRATNSHPET